MGYIVKQLLLSGYESSGGHSLAVVEVDAAADFATLPTYQNGSIGYIKGDPDSLYILDTTWKLVQKSALEAGDQIEIDGVSPYTLAMVFKLLQGQLARLTATEALANTSVQADPTQFRYFILDAIPEVASELFVGKVVFNTTDSTFKVLTTKGTHEKDTLTVTKGAETKSGNITITLNTEDVVVAIDNGALAVKAATITAGASSSGNITVTLDGVPTVVAVAASDTAAAVAGKITTAFAANEAWTVGNTQAVLTFTAKAKGPKAGSFTIAAASTGVTCTDGITNTTTGVLEDTAAMVAAKIKTAVEAAVVAESIAAWTVTINGATLVFTRAVVGTAVPPTAVDTDETGATFSAFARTVEGAASVWGSCINAP